MRIKASGPRRQVGPGAGDTLPQVWGGGRPSIVHSKKQAGNGKAAAVTLLIVADT